MDRWIEIKRRDKEIKEEGKYLSLKEQSPSQIRLTRRYECLTLKCRQSFLILYDVYFSQLKLSGFTVPNEKYTPNKFIPFHLDSLLNFSANDLFRLYATNVIGNFNLFSPIFFIDDWCDRNLNLSLCSAKTPAVCGLMSLIFPLSLPTELLI